MAYPYYQQVPPGQPGYGATHITFAPPPAPAFQPQSTWGGLDYYRAHAPSQDPALFQHAWDRVRQFDMATASGLGVGIHEARHWHRRAYGGMNELSVMTPTEIGHAAAYEAYRTWMHNRSMYEPLGPDIERQREGLIGLAVAESSRLLSFAGRAMDYYARQTASDAAAHTASFIFYQRRQDDEYSYHRGRSGSRYGDYDYEDEDPYIHDRFDDPYSDGYRDYGRRGRSHSRRRARSLSRPRSFYEGYEGTPYPTPGLPLTPGMPPPMHPPTPGGMPIHPGGTPYPGQPMSFGGSNYAGSAAGGIGGQPYYGAPGVSVYGQQPGQIGYPGGSHVPIAPPMGYANSSGSAYSGYSQPGYGGMGMGMGMGAMPMGTAMSQGSMGGVVQAPPQTIVIHKSRRHRHHRSRSRGSA